MGNAIFPTLPGLAWSVTKTPTWKTTIQRSVSGKETRASYQARPIWSFTLSYEVLRGYSGLTEYQQLVAFFNQRMGAFDSFLFQDGSDSSVSGQNFGTGDGATTQYQLRHSISGWVEPIGYAPSPTVYVNSNDWRGNVQKYAVARTNLLKYTEQGIYGTTSNGDTGSVGNYGTAPDGSLTSLLVQNGTRYRNATGLTVGQTYTYSLFAKQGSATGVSVYRDGGVQSSSCGFNFATASMGSLSNASSSSATAFPNGWFRLSVTFVADAALSSFHYYPTGGSAEFWGAQLEAGAVPTPYIPSTDSFASRGSTATYLGSDGNIKTAAANVARWQYNPSNLSAPSKLLLEGAATNLLLYSSQLTAGSWSTNGDTSTANYGVAPDGTVSSTLISGGTRFQGATLTSGAVYTYSEYVKAGTAPAINLYRDGGGVICDAVFNFSAQSFTSFASVISASVLPLSNGWFRISMTFTAPNSTNTFHLYPNGGSAEFWGAQLESGSCATSYVPTAAAIATRAADGSTSAASTVTDYTCDGVNVTFGAAPAAGAALTWTGQFYYRVRFKQDMMDFEQFMKDFWQLKKCELVGVL